MAIKVACPNPDCKAEYQVAEDRLGQSAKCHKCGLKFTLQISADETGAAGGNSPRPLAGEGPGDNSPRPYSGEGQGVRAASQMPLPKKTPPSKSAGGWLGQ